MRGVTGSGPRGPVGTAEPLVFAVCALDETVTPPPPAGRLGARAVVALLVIAAASMVAQGFGRFTYPVLLDAINDDILQSYGRAGLLGTASLVAYLLGTGVVAWASTRIDAGSLMRFGIVLSLSGLALLTVAPDFLTLGIALFIAGLGGAAVWIPAPGIGAMLVGPARAGLAVGLVGSGIGMGIVVAGPLTNAVRTASGDAGAWRPVYAVQAGIAAVVLVALFLIRRSTSPPSAQQDKVPFGVIRTVPGWYLLVGAFAVFGVAYSLYFYFLVAQLRSAGWSPSASSLVFALTGVASVLGGLVFGRLSDRYPRPNVMAVGFALMVAAPLLSLQGTPVSVTAAAIAFGLCVSGTPTTIGAMVADHLSGRAFGAAFGTLTLGFGISQLAGPPFAGFVGEATGSFTVPFLVASAMAAVGIVISLRARRFAIRR